MQSISNLYIEPTSHCNLHCAMCSRNHWQNESIGHMPMPVFEKILHSIPAYTARIFFGGIGEPFTHPDILHMIRLAKGTGLTVEAITNGTLLNEDILLSLIDSKLDKLWISLDSAHEKGYAALHQGANHSSIMDNIRTLNRLLHTHTPRFYARLRESAYPKLCIAFVLTKSNQSQLKELLENADALGIYEIKVSHLIPYDEAQVSEICYDRLLGTGMFSERNPLSVHVDMPLLEAEQLQSSDLLSSLTNPNLSLSVLEQPLRRRRNWCKFVNDGYIFVRWDGEICPCMALLHDHTYIQRGIKRHNRHCSFGHILNADLQEVWDSADYSAFRQRVTDFTFSPCTACGSCDMFETNQTDCENNPFPTCGACLWAQGLFQCP